MLKIITYSILFKQYFHDRYLEYSHGFLIFERTMDQIEIWRKSVDYQLDPAPSVWVPDQKQMEFSLRAQKRYPSKTKHGHFQPWALLSIPNVGMGYGFAYPNLLVASTSTATIWNVLTCQAVHQFNTMTHYALNSIDFNDQHAFICTPDHLRIFSHDGRLVWTVAAGVKSQEFYSNDRLQITPNLTSFDRETKPVDFQPITPESPALQKGSFHAGKQMNSASFKNSKFVHSECLAVRKKPRYHVQSRQTPCSSGFPSATPHEYPRETPMFGRHYHRNTFQSILRCTGRCELPSVRTWSDRISNFHRLVHYHSRLAARCSRRSHRESTIGPFIRVA